MLLSATRCAVAHAARCGLVVQQLHHKPAPGWLVAASLRAVWPGHLRLAVGCLSAVKLQDSARTLLCAAQSYCTELLGCYQGAPPPALAGSGTALLRKLPNGVLHHVLQVQQAEACTCSTVPPTAQ